MTAVKVPEPKKRPQLVCMEDIEEREIEWLWYPYIPKGAAILMFGPGGVGKSHIVCDLAARISRGKPFPHEKGDQKHQPGRVLMMSAEDDADAVLKPNLRLAGADMKKIFVPDTQFVFDTQGIRYMAEFMSTCQATVVFIDPIVAYLGGKVDMFRANEVRNVMGVLNDTARSTGTAMIIVGHDRKNKEGTQQDKAMGSADFVNAPRGAVHVVEDKFGPAMWHVKSNYGPKGPGIAYTFEENVFTWGDEREESEPVFGRSGGGKSGERESQAEAFLLDLLKNGPVPSKEVEAASRDQKIVKRTLDRAKDELGVESFCNKKTGKLVWYWKLPEGSN